VIQRIEGNVSVGGEMLAAGDGAAIEDADEISIESRSGSELLLFDLK
jgi:redox-sensitive bicupin YhaK (pirin superfamily)